MDLQLFGKTTVYHLVPINLLIIIYDTYSFDDFIWEDCLFSI